MQKITPFLWFGNNAKEAADFYTSIFKDSEITGINYYGNSGGKISKKPKGSVMIVSFHLQGQEFIALNGGPYFSFSPATSFFVNCKTNPEIDALWNNLSSNGGTVLMNLDKYPFSEKFGWLSDRYGVSWQLALANSSHTITPFLLFTGDQYRKVEEAINYYISVFENSHIINIEHYRSKNGDVEKDRSKGVVKHAIFSLNGQEFMASESNAEHSFSFTPAISFVVNCETQDEIDYFWERLSEGGKTEQCGWLSDRYGVSWQIAPNILGQLMSDKDVEKSERVMKAMLQMKKIVIKDLQQAYNLQH
ncbi:MAG: VOC family protein [Candidatus Nitrosocosmicus sp.]